MTDSMLLESVKQCLGISGTHLDRTLSGYVDEVKSYLLDAGVKSEVLDSTASVGVITRGVSDLWNYGSGSAKLSEYFYQRAIQLVHTEVKES